MAPPNSIHLYVQFFKMNVSQNSRTFEFINLSSKVRPCVGVAKLPLTTVFSSVIPTQDKRTRHHTGSAKTGLEIFIVVIVNFY